MVACSSCFGHFLHACAFNYAFRTVLGARLHLYCAVSFESLDGDAPAKDCFGKRNLGFGDYVFCVALEHGMVLHGYFQQEVASLAHASLHLVSFALAAKNQARIYTRWDCDLLSYLSSDRTQSRA